MIPNKNTGGYFATHYDEIIHWLMACYAGFGGMYSVVLHARNFVNAQTGNLMSITEDFLGGDFFSVMTRVGALIMFAAGVVVSFLLSQKIQKDMRKIVICVNAVAITLVALMPLTWDPIMTIYPMIFAASFQWGTFSEAQGYASATIFLSKGHSLYRNHPFLYGWLPGSRICCPAGRRLWSLLWVCPSCHCHDPCPSFRPVWRNRRGRGHGSDQRSGRRRKDARMMVPPIFVLTCRKKDLLKGNKRG